MVKKGDAFMELIDYEYTVAQKNEGKWKRRKNLMLSAYFLYVLAYFLIIYKTRIIPLGALIPITLWILIFFTWRYVKPEYQYKITEANLIYSIIYGSRTKKQITSFRICDADYILPLAEAEDTMREYAPKIIYNALPAKVCEDAYAILYKNSKGDACAFFFKATAQGLKSLRFYNSKTVVRETAV